MRKKFLLVVLVPLVIISIIVYIFIDSWITSGLEYAGEKAAGAKVEIVGLHVHLFPLGIEWAGMQVANHNDPWKNLFQTGKVSFLIDTGQLLRGKYIINIVELKDFIIGTKRTTDGALPKEVVPPVKTVGTSTNGEKSPAAKTDNSPSFSKMAEDAFKNSVTVTPLFDLAKLRNGFNADSLISILDLKSTKHIDTLKTQIDQLNTQWSSTQKDLDVQKQKVLDIENQVKTIDPSKLNNVQNIMQAITTVDKAKKTLNDISKFVNDKTSSIKDNVQTITGSIGQIKNYVNEDFDHLKSMARLPSINTSGMASLLVGNEMYKRAQKYLYWADAARTNIKKYNPQPDYTYPPRFKGQDIRFPEERSYPKYWVKKIDISGGTDTSATDYITASGDADNITNNQDLTGQPMTIALQGTANNVRTLKLAALFDRRKDTSVDEFNVSLSGVPVVDFSLGNSNFLPTKVTKANMDTQAKLLLVGNKIDATINFDLKDVSLQFQSEPKNLVEQLFRQVLDGVKDFNIGLRMWNTNGPFDVAISTDLDDILAKKVSAVVGEEISKLQADLRKKFDDAVQKQVDSFNKTYQPKLDQLKNQLGSYQSLLTDNMNIIDKKKQELLDKQKNGLLKDKLKGLFK